MVFSEEFDSYYNELIQIQKLDTDALYKSQRERNRPIIKRDGAIMLQQYVLAKEPKLVLEIGTNGGYSAICMAKVLNHKSKLHTIDFRWDHLKIAKKNFMDFGVIDKIVTHQGYAKEVIKNLNLKFDIIFIDADKGGYPDYLEYATKYINRNGIILVDNLLWKGTVFSKEPSVSPATKTLQEFNKVFMNLNGFKSIILPVGDGLGVAVKEI
ncbi:MAG: methyltransferase [Candidatus Cloacimonadota bacterium]|nr:MAG: methyltransferase [Candidatus Cloacimonadota bacterium]PIE77751.1 MAG: methyltransferase [Candidatus Delongbacteria bacterium]